MGTSPRQKDLDKEASTHTHTQLDIQSASMYSGTLKQFAHIHDNYEAALLVTASDES